LALLHQLKGGTLYPSVLLFYNNFIDHYTDGGFNFWFIEVFAQLHLLFFGLCAIPRFRNWVRNAPYTVSLALFAIGFVLNQTMPLLWNTDHIYNLVPYRFICYFALGWCLFFGRGTRQRALNSGLVVLLCSMQLPAISEALWVLFGGMLMAWSPPVRLPRSVATVVGAVASASLYIYLTHQTAFSVVMALPIPHNHLLQIPCALVGGVIAGVVIERGSAMAKKLLLSRLR